MASRLGKKFVIEIRNWKTYRPRRDGERERGRERENTRATRGSFVPSELKRTRVGFLLEKVFFISVRTPRNKKALKERERERERERESKTNASLGIIFYGADYEERVGTSARASY